MKHTNYSEETLRRYLMEDLPAPEQAAFETEFFSDRELYEQICEAENDLVDDYLRGRMSPTDRAQFERRYFATPERRQQVEFARAMMRSLAQTESTASAERITSASVPSGLTGWWPSLLAPLRGPKLALGVSLALALLLALAGAWLLMTRRDLSQDQVASAALRARAQELEKQLASEHVRNEQLTAELERIREHLQTAQKKQSSQHSTAGSRPADVEAIPSPDSTPVIATLLLSGSLDRDKSRQETFRVPPDAEIVQIQLKLKSSDSPNYQATIKTVEGKFVWSRRQVNAKGATVSLRIPARLLPTGDYLLTLGGVSAAGEIEDVSYSYFRVDKR